MGVQRLIAAALQLHTVTFCAVLLAQAANIQRDLHCDLEGGLCGWTLGEPSSSYSIGWTEARAAPGPRIDALPGTEQGHYVYMNYTGPVSDNPETLLTFPTYHYICSISLSYFSSSPSLDISVLRFNIGRDFLSSSTEPTTSQWSQWTVDYDVSQGTDEEYQLKILIEGAGVEGEAEEEDVGLQVVAVDNITLSFCLPCDFDLLPEPGNLVLTAPSALNLSLGHITNFSLTASSPLCPSLPLVFNIEAVEPPSLGAIFSVERETGLVMVDATGPHLLAEGALGHINVSVHVLGSNYTQTGPPHRATATIILEQDPVIRLHDPPSQLMVEVDELFSLQIHAAHILPSSQPLTYHLHTSPDSLQSHITIDQLGEVMGVITVETIPDILGVGGANLTVGVANEYGSSLNLTIPILFPPTPPLLLNSDLSFVVAENHSMAMRFHPIATLSLVDPNGDPVTLPATSWEEGTFELYPLGAEQGVWLWEGGLFVDQTMLDFESQLSYSLNLSVTDSVNSSLSTSLTILITVTSENEHAPQFINFKSSETIQASWAAGALVTPEKATDQDQGPAGHISYSIPIGNNDLFFLIDQSGDVRVATSPLLPGAYRLTILATDGGSPPLSTSGVLTVNVTAVGEVDCTGDDAYDVPVIHSIGIDDSHVRTPVGSNATLYCSYQANPAVALYKWEVNPVIPPVTSSYVYPLPSPTSHISLLPHQLTLVGVTASDAAFYTCNVTNWCGSATAVHILFVIDYPLPVRSLSCEVVQRDSSQDTPLYPSSLHITWLPPSPNSPSSPHQGHSPLLDITADYYIIQVALFTGNPSNSYRDIANVSTSATSVLVDNLLPGNKYHVRVASVNEAGATPSDNISVTLPQTTPKLQSVDTTQESNNTILVTWKLAYDGGSPITKFTITISPRAPRSRRQTGGVVYHVEPSAGALLSGPLEGGRRYRVSLSLENTLGEQSYSLSEYVGHVDSVECDFEPQQVCPWRLGTGATITHTFSGGVVEDVVYGQGSEVILEHTAAGYSCGYGFSYELWGGAGLQVRVGGGEGGVVWEDHGDTGGKWKQVNTSESVDVDYLTTSLGSHLGMVLTGNGSAGGGGARVDQLSLDFCLPCDFSSLHLPGMFSLDYPKTVTLHFRESSTILIAALLTDCPTAVIEVDTIRVVPGVLERYVSTEVEGHNISLSVDPIPSDVSVQTGLLQVSVLVVGSDYSSPAGDGSTAVVGVAEIEFLIEEREEGNCSDVITCGFEGGGACGWRLGEHTFITVTQTHGIGVRLNVSDSQTGGMVLSREFPGDKYCRLSFRYLAQGAELVVMVTGVGVVWTSGTNRENPINNVAVANFTFDLRQFTVLNEREVILSLGEVWDDGSGAVELFRPTLYPCTQCPTTPPDGCPPEPTPAVCITAETCPGNTDGLLVAAVGGLSAAVAVLLACYCCTLILVIYCLRITRRVSQKQRRRREMERQRLVSDGDSIGTAGSLSRASAAGDRRRWRKYGESSTLMTFVPDEDSGGDKRGREESSWLQTVELTHTHHRTPLGGGGGTGGVGVVRGLGVRGEVLQNPLYEDEDYEEGEGEREGEVEMSAMEFDWALPPPSPTHSSDL